MRPLLFSTSVAETATFAAITGAVASDYPIGNLADPVAISKAARITPSGGIIAISSVLAADQTVGGAALVAHTLPAGATIRARFYADAGMSALVQDVAATAIPTPVAGYAQTYPVLMTTAATIRAVRLDIAAAGAGAVDIGAVQVGAVWEWPYITAGMDAGFKTPAADIELEGGGALGGAGALKRSRSGQVSWLALAVSSTTGLDFQARKALARPFVFVEDYSTPAHWPRDCFLAVNSDLPPMVAAMFDRDSYQFRFLEHRR